MTEQIVNIRITLSLFLEHFPIVGLQFFNGRSVDLLIKIHTSTVLACSCVIIILFILSKLHSLSSV